MKDVNNAFQEMHAEGQGVWSVDIFPPEARIDMVLGACLGRDQRMQSVLLSVVEMAKQHGLCLTCDNEFSRSFMPHTVVLLQAARDDPRKMVTSAICEHCAANHRNAESLKAAVVGKYQKEFGSGFRVLPTPSDPAHA